MGALSFALLERDCLAGALAMKLTHVSLPLLKEAIADLSQCSLTCSGAPEVLHIFAQSRRYIQAPLYLSSTVFFHKDFWKADLSQADVVAIYGLHPIMKDLGTKMMKELKPGSLVLSNVFAIPGWRPSSLSQDGVHVYIVPDCWGHNDTKPQTRKS
jgi:hypothetical protein